MATGLPGVTVEIIVPIGRRVGRPGCNPLVTRRQNHHTELERGNDANDENTNDYAPPDEHPAGGVDAPRPEPLQNGVLGPRAGHPLRNVAARVLVALQRGGAAGPLPGHQFLQLAATTGAGGPGAGRAPRGLLVPLSPLPGLVGALRGPRLELSGAHVVAITRIHAEGGKYAPTKIRSISISFHYIVFISICILMILYLLS